MAGCTAKKIMDEQKEALGDNALKRTAVFKIVKRVKEGSDLTDNRGKFDLWKRSLGYLDLSSS